MGVVNSPAGEADPSFGARSNAQHVMTSVAEAKCCIPVKNRVLEDPNPLLIRITTVRQVVGGLL
jgi:hypothetical protein